MNWSNYFAEYLVFLMESITMVIAILVVISMAIALSLKQKGRKTGLLIVKSLNKRYNSNKKIIEKAISTKREYKSLLKKYKAENSKDQKNKKKIYIIEFTGDIRASEVEGLREEVNAILSIATLKDEVVVKLESPGGVVHGYGLAAAQLSRLREANISLTILVDKVAASGGYMMASVGDKIFSSPFAMVGSIGVIAQLPNFNKFLSNKGIEVELHTAGKYKRTLTSLGENTEEGRRKFREELNDIHNLFKIYISKYRPALNIDEVGTGEYWFGTDALDKGLVDGLITSDQYLMDKYLHENYQLYQVKYLIKKGKLHKIQAMVEHLLVRYEA